jgi:hypothetical protein
MENIMSEVIVRHHVADGGSKVEFRKAISESASATTTLRSPEDNNLSPWTCRHALRLEELAWPEAYTAAAACVRMR